MIDPILVEDIAAKIAKETGGPANPVKITVGNATMHYPGMTLHDYFMGQLASAINPGGWDPDEYASKVSKFADALIRQKIQREAEIIARIDTEFNDD